ncbi:LANO_0D00980g1_1 [Lachancea nothofagi CBS 11611]|uniref:LANO_0D00980g1_1 n=1 Tax=Lachancea nothofagi CBS 11611 TaxID=1266666 RepID=A0A1G4JD27_9SACH|nr:LANO_0D00980g1_1 [Lachancea nothofagi CBS 11611]
MSEPLLTSIVAGSTAAVFQTTVSYPFEMLKTGLQLHRSLPGVPPFEMMHQLKTYFAGCAALNVGTLLKTATRFTTFDSACQLLRDPESGSKAISGPRLLAAGVITGFMESLLVIPFENIKTTMIENALAPKPEKAAQDIRPKFHAQKNSSMNPRQKWFVHYEALPSTNFLSTIQEIYRTRGFRGFAQGSVCTIIRQTSNSAVRFTTYTTLKQFVSPNKPLNEYYAFALGLVSSCAVVAVTQPIDVVKTRMQSKYSWMNYKNSLNCAYRIFVEEGFPKFWKGWAPRLMKVGLSGGVSFGVFQYTENLMNSMTKPKNMGHD